ncbi:MAG: hypothetical protein ABL860_00205, partial [Candidatus Nitrotoga sp.]
MPLTITKRITIGVATMVFFSGLLSLLLYVDLKKIIDTLEQVLKIKEPVSATAYELEINMLEIGLRVMQYSPVQAKNERALLATDIANFEKFYSKYTQLASTQHARDLGIKVQTLYTEFKGLGLIIMNGRDTLSRDVQNFETNLLEIESLIDSGLMKSAAPRASQGLEKLLSAQIVAPKTTEKLLVLQAMGAHLAVLGNSLGDYLETKNPLYKQRIIHH